MNDEILSIEEAELREIWKADLLDRRADAEFLIDFLTGKAGASMAGAKRSYVLNIDAGWGYGKTFFLDRFKQTIERRGHLVAQVNAWADDHAEDPLLPVMTAIDSAIAATSGITPKTKKTLSKLLSIGGQVAIAAGKGIVQQAAQRYVGESAIETFKQAGGEVAGSLAKGVSEQAGNKLSNLYDAGGQALIDKFERGRKSIKEFKVALSNVLKEFGPNRKPLFVLIDELDRCRPIYAINLLERVKHIFEIDDVVFVLATDTEQLKHSIAGVYGSQFDAGGYLHRFFDQTYRFEAPRRRALIEFLVVSSSLDVTKLSAPPESDALDYLAIIFDALDSSLREVEQNMQILGNCVASWTYAAPIELAVIMPLVLAQQRRILPTFDASFRNALDGARHKNIALATIELRAVRTGDGPQTQDGWNVFDRFVSYATGKTLYEMMNHFDEIELSRASSLERWVIDAFRREIRLRFPAGFDTRKPPRSLIVDYPKLVRTAGRLRPPDDPRPRQ